MKQRVGTVRPQFSGPVDESVDYSKLSGGRADASNTQYYKSTLSIKMYEQEPKPLIESNDTDSRQK
jgi:hypothetical protein